MRSFRELFLHAAWAICLCGPGGIIASETDKSQYHLLNPVPRDAMRPLITDRPSLTEGPYTVDAGHFQVESDIATWTHDTDASGVDSEMTKLASVNLKTGLLPSLDLHLILDSYVRTRVEDRAAGLTDRASGLGDLTIRFKKNFWGNDSGASAFGVIPYVKGGLRTHLPAHRRHPIGRRLQFRGDRIGPRLQSVPGYFVAFLNDRRGLPLTSRVGLGAIRVYLHASPSFPSFRSLSGFGPGPVRRRGAGRVVPDGAGIRLLGPGQGPDRLEVQARRELRRQDRGQ
ncbi:MAG: transporter [Proteobacteria bacterium]|nr:transporter [Pseudomonadota bacterium]